MTQYPAGPYTLEYPYVVDGISHTLEVNCDVIGTPAPGDASTAVYLRTKDGVSATVDDCANALWDVVRPVFKTTTIAAVYTLWKRNPTNNDRQFITGGSLATPNGSSALANQLASQSIYVWRSANGSVMRLNLLEGVPAANSSGPLVSGDTFAWTISQFILSDANFVMARDRSFPVAPLSASYGQNEKIFRRRYRG